MNKKPEAREYLIRIMTPQKWKVRRAHQDSRDVHFEMHLMETEYLRTNTTLHDYRQIHQSEDQTSLILPNFANGQIAPDDNTRHA